MTLVFVYGSLKQGFGNNRLLSGSEFKGEAITNNEFAMVDMGAFPGVLRINNIEFIGKIKGELYEVDDKTLSVLDRLESNGSFYNREIIVVLLPHNEAPVRAWIYLLMDSRYNEFIMPVNGMLDWSH